jgi:hypothetical protein
MEDPVRNTLGSDVLLLVQYSIDYDSVTWSHPTVRAAGEVCLGVVIYSIVSAIWRTPKLIYLWDAFVDSMEMPL